MSSISNKRWEIILQTFSVIALIWLAVLVYINSISHKTSEPMPIESSEYPLTIIDIPDDLQGLGKIVQGEQVIAAYTINNTGKEVLHIENVNPDCTCTDYKLSSDLVPVGGSSILTLYVDTKYKIGPNQIYATLTCNTDEKFHFVKLYFDVVSDVNVNK